MSILPILLLALASLVAAYNRRTHFKMPEYERFDPQVHSYDLISDEDIWEHRVVEQMGVVNMTVSVYMDHLYGKHKQGDKPWFICIVTPNKSNTIWHSSYLMKSMYFLQRDFPEKAVYAFADAANEMIREAFDYEFIPQCVFVKDGKPYYVGWDVLGTNLIQEFMVRYEELA